MDICKCKQCGTAFVAIRPSHLYCSALCRVKAFRAKAKLPTTSDKAKSLLLSLDKRFKAGGDRTALIEATHRELFDFVASLVDLPKE